MMIRNENIKILFGNSVGRRKGQTGFDPSRTSGNFILETLRIVFVFWNLRINAIQSHMFANLMLIVIKIFVH